MKKFLFTGDWHLRGTNPRNRIDDYKASVLDKLEEVFAIARENEVDAILTPGDTWDRPEVSIGVLLEFADELQELQSVKEIPIITTPGNHDIYGCNVNSYYRTSLRLLELLVPNFRVLCGEGLCEFFGDVSISAAPYDMQMDRDGYGYSPHGETCHRYNIHIAHGMLLDHVPPFERYTLIKDVKTKADLVLTGHDHTGYGVYRRADGVIFCNPGSLTRLSASAAEMERKVQVALIKADCKGIEVELIPLQCAKPGSEVLDRSGIEAEQQRRYAMEEFAALIQTGAGNQVILNVDDIVATIAKQESLAPEVVAKTLDVINEQKYKTA